MAEYTAVAIQTVAENENILFTDTAICGNGSIYHRGGSGQITLRGITVQCRARFKVTFGANIAIPTGGTVEAISAAIAVNGEALASSTMIFTPAATEEFNNIGRSIYIDVPVGCCLTISIKNTSTQPIEVQNATLIVERVA